MGAVMGQMLRGIWVPNLTRVATTRAPGDFSMDAARKGNDDENGHHEPSDGCAAIVREFATVLRDILTGRTAQVRNDLTSISHHIEQAYTARALTQVEHDVLVSDVSMVLARLLPEVE